MKKKLVWICAALSAAMLLLGGCFLFEEEEHGPPPTTYYVDISAEAKYGGEVETGTEQVAVGSRHTLKAYDTDEYEFWYWELNGEKVSELAVCSVIAQTDATYYAVFKPKAEDEILINVVCEKDAYARTWYGDTDVLGGGYYKKGEEVRLESDDYLPVSWFTIGEEKTRGPYLIMTPQKSVTVKAQFEYACEVVIKDSSNCEIQMTEGERLLGLGERSKFTYTIDEGYVADQWKVTYYYSTQMAESNGTEYYEIEYAPEHEPVIGVSGSIDFVRAEVSLIATNENLVDTYEWEIVSSDGASVSVLAPEKRIAGRGYRATFTPNEDAYIREIGLLTDGGFVEVKAGGYLGGEFYVPDTSDLGADERTVLYVYTIKKENAAIVNVISDDEHIKTNLELGGIYAPTLATETFVVQKGVTQAFVSSRDNNLKAIYDHGYQFSHISDGAGNRISDTMAFEYAVYEDTDFYIHYSEKPIADEYFDYHLLEDGSGYEVRLSPLHDYYGRFSTPVEELAIPSSYNGKPVTSIGAYGMSWYRKGLEEDWCYIGMFSLFEKLYVPSSIKVIKEKAFANLLETEIILNEDVALDSISPDAFYSESDSVQVTLTKAQLGTLVNELHERYIGDSAEFAVRFEEDAHFDSEGELGHYEAYAEHLCLKESIMEEISAFELSLIYHEFAHHYQFVARVGVKEETYDTLRVQPTREEVEAWNEPYDTEDYDAYWNHPMERDARSFALQWTGYDQAQNATNAE